MKEFYYSILFFLIVITFGCPAPEENYVVGNVSDEDLELNYEVVDCSRNPIWENWKPKVLSHEDFLKGSSWDSDLAKDLYSVSINTEIIENIERECGIAAYQIKIPGNTMIRIALENFRALNKVRYFRMEGARGTVIFKGANLTLSDCFKKYQANVFSGNQHVIWYYYLNSN
jgi:hypothetical protein